MHTKLELLLSKSLTTLEVMTYYLVLHTGPGRMIVKKREEPRTDDKDYRPDTRTHNGLVNTTELIIQAGGSQSRRYRILRDTMTADRTENQDRQKNSKDTMTADEPDDKDRR